MKMEAVKMAAENLALRARVKQLEKELRELQEKHCALCAFAFPRGDGLNDCVTWLSTCLSHEGCTRFERREDEQ